VFQRLLHEIPLVDNRFALEGFVAGVSHGRVSVTGWLVRLRWAAFTSLLYDSARLIAVAFGHGPVQRLHVTAIEG
jgi:hypothetical protein